MPDRTLRGLVVVPHVHTKLKREWRAEHLEVLYEDEQVVCGYVEWIRRGMSFGEANGTDALVALVPRCRQARSYTAVPSCNRKMWSLIMND